MDPTQIPVRVLKHQARAFRLALDGKPKTITLVWGRGLGKSYFLRLICWLLVARYFGQKRKTLDGWLVGVRIYIMMPTLKQFKQVHGALFEAECQGKWAFLGGKLNKTDYSITFPDGSYIIPVPAALANSERGRGFRGDVAIFDEGDDIDKSVRTSIVKPWLSEPWSLGLELIGGTPKRGRHGMLFEGYSDGQSEAPELDHCHSFKARSADCPEVFNPRLLAEAKLKYPPAVYAREFEVDFDSAEGLVYPFEEDFHVLTPPENMRFTRYVIGGDHGWNDPGVLLLGGLFGHGEDSGVWILDEHYHSEKPNHEWDAIVRDNYQGLRGWLDPSRPDRIADYRRAGLNAHGADNSIEAGVARVAELLFRRKVDDGNDFARLYVHPRCVNTIREFKSYRRKRDPRDPNAYLEDIEDRNNHAMDSLRYLCVGEFGRALSPRYESPGS